MKAVQVEHARRSSPRNLQFQENSSQDPKTNTADAWGWGKKDIDDEIVVAVIVVGAVMLMNHIFEVIWTNGPDISATGS